MIRWFRSCGFIFVYADLADFNEELHRRAVNNPEDCLPAFEDAFETVIRDQENASKVSSAF